MQSFPKLPILGWSAFFGEQALPTCGVLSVRHRRYTTSGRAAIVLALRVLNVNPGDKVLVPTYHCPTMITPVISVGAQPNFYPVTATGGANLEWLRQANLVGVRAMLVAHYFGIPQPMLEVREFCDVHRIALIEDCAHGFFGTSNGVALGNWGDVAIASLTKFFPVTEGGLIVSSKHSLDAVVLSARRWRDEVRAVADAIELGVIHHRFPGINSILGGVFTVKNWLRNQFRSPDIAASPTDENIAPNALVEIALRRPAVAARWVVGRVSQSRIIGRRRRNYAALANKLSGIDGAHALFPNLPAGTTPYVFPLYVSDPEASYQRMRSIGIPLFRWDDIWSGTPVLDGDHGLDWADRVFQLACHQDLSLENIDTIATAVRSSIQS